MRRPRNVIQYTFEGGEADPQFERRADADLWGLTAEKMRNVRLLYGGGFSRRPGLARCAALDGVARLVPFRSRAGASRLLAFRDDEIDVFDPSEALEGTLLETGIAAAHLATMQFAQIDDKLIVASRGFFPVQIAWDEATQSFSEPEPFEFDTYGDGARGWPYYRFRETRGVTLKPNARTGSITLEASDDVFHADHVGVRFTLCGREVTITAVTDAKHASATVVQELYPTVRITVASTSGFAAGQIVQDQVGDIEMEVAEIVSGTVLDAVLTDGFTQPTTTDNKLLGPNGATAISGVTTSSPGATVQWKEQLISDYRGYPGGVVMHKDRLTFYDFPQAPELHAMSVIGFDNDFDTGSGLDDEAIIDGPGDAKGKRVFHCVSMEQLVSLTEAGSYYVGEGPNTPLTPSNVEFLAIGPEAAGGCNPIKTAEGVIFAESGADRLMLLSPTGQLRRAWGSTELLGAASKLFNSPTRLLLVDGSDLGPERYIMAVNNDGTLCVIHYRRDSELAGATLWTTDGEFVDVCQWEGKVYVVAARDGAHLLCRFDNDRLLDFSVLIDNAESGAPTHADLASESGIALVWRKEERRVDLGETYEADSDGALSGAPTYARDYEAGVRFTPLVRPWPPIDPMFGPIEFQRICGASLDVLDSGSYYAMGQLFSPYRATDDVSEPPPLRTGWRKRKYSGRKRDWRFDLSQVEAAPWTVRALTMEVR